MSYENEIAMASAMQSTSDNTTTEMKISIESTASHPVPAKRKIKMKADDSTLEESLFNEVIPVVIDNSRVHFVDEDIVKNEVHISEINNTKDFKQICESNSVDQNSTISTNGHQANSKSRIASYIEKFNSNSSSSQMKVVICKVNVNDQGVVNASDPKIQINTDHSIPVTPDVPSSPEMVKCEPSEKTLNENIQDNQTKNILDTQDVKNTIDASSKQENNETASIEGCKENDSGGTGNVIYKQEIVKMNDSMSAECVTKPITNKAPIPAPRSFILTSQQCYEMSNAHQLNIMKTSSESSKTSMVSDVSDGSMSSSNIIDRRESILTENINNSKHDNHSLKIHKNENGNSSDLRSKETNDCTDEKTNNIFLAQNKPTLMKKPTTLTEQFKTEKVLNGTKPNTLEKSINIQEKESKLKKPKPITDRSSSFECEPKLTKKQRTSSEQCLSMIKGDNDMSINTKKLKCMIEQLQNETSTLKKLLESERSAFREHKALHETEMRKERGEAKRREAVLESQVRAALKGQPVPMKVAGASGECDLARLTTALETAKSANKSLQEKIQILTEADKRKVAELRTQHDAHAAVIQQMERDSRAQMAKLLEELKSKERQLELLKKGGKGPMGGASGGVGSGSPTVPGKIPSKMAVADQLHLMEGQISKLEHEIQRRDEIIQSLRGSKTKRERKLSSSRQSKDNLFKDIVSDVDSAVSSAPNSLSPQPSPDLWYRLQDGSHVEIDEGLLEAAKKQIQELEKALNISSLGQKQALLRASQLEEQLQDLREHADLLEFRCLELEDASEKRNSIGELTDSDSGCTSPENRLKNSVSPQLRRSDSGYKSPTRPTSPCNIKSTRAVNSPPTASLTDTDAIVFPDSHKEVVNNLHLQDIDVILENGNHGEDIKDRLERMLLRTHCESDRICLEQVLQLLWNLQSLSRTLTHDNYSTTKNKKNFESDVNKQDLDHTKSGRIIATISPYSQNALIKPNDLTKSDSGTESELVDSIIKEESKKLLYGLQESGIFEESDWDNKETQTDWCDCAYTESESDLATEVQRLNQIREQLEKSGAIRSRNLKNRSRVSDLILNDNCEVKQQKKRDRKRIEIYECRISQLENKISIYECSDEIREKRLAQRLQREIDLQALTKNLEFDLAKLRKKCAILEEEKCEFEEAENDTRLHCQELEAEFDILTAKLRDLDDQRSCAKNEAECYRQLVEEYEYKTMMMQQQELELTNKLNVIEKSIPALISFNVYKSLEDIFEGNNLKENFLKASSSTTSKVENRNQPLMIEYKEVNFDFNDKNSAISQKDLHRSKNERSDDDQRSCSSKSDKTSSSHIPNQDSEYMSARSDQSLCTQSTKTSTEDSEPCECRLQATHKVEELLCGEQKMKQRIEELEKRELAYLETLTKGDEMWAEMEFSYKYKIKEIQENEKVLLNGLNRWKTLYEQLEPKIYEMEENETCLRQQIKDYQEEIKELVKQKELHREQIKDQQEQEVIMKAEMCRLYEEAKQVSAVKLQICQMKENEMKMKIENSNLKSEIDQMKCQKEQLENQMKVQSTGSESCKVEHKTESNKSLIGGEKSQSCGCQDQNIMRVTQDKLIYQDECSEQKRMENINQQPPEDACCDVLDMKKELLKTTAELKRYKMSVQDLISTVHTLEMKLNDVTGVMCQQSLEFEEKTKSLLGEVNDKNKEVEQLKSELMQCQQLPSAKEELSQVMSLDEKCSNKLTLRCEKKCVNDRQDKNCCLKQEADKQSETCSCDQVHSFLENNWCDSQHNCNKTSEHLEDNCSCQESLHKIIEEKCDSDHKSHEVELQEDKFQKVDNCSQVSDHILKTTTIDTECQTLFDKISYINQLLDTDPNQQSFKWKNSVDCKVSKVSKGKEVLKNRIVPEKPEPPKRKPKISIRIPPKPKLEETKKRVLKNSSRKSDANEIDPPLLLIDRGDCVRSDMENNICRLLNRSTDNCMDDNALSLCRQLMGDVKNLLTLLPDEIVKKTYLDTVLQHRIDELNNEKYTLEEENEKLKKTMFRLQSINNMLRENKVQEKIRNDNTAAGKRLNSNALDRLTLPKEGSQLDRNSPTSVNKLGKKIIVKMELCGENSSNVKKMNISPVPVPRRHSSHVNSSIKRYHSLSESTKDRKTEDLSATDKSDSVITCNNATAKELIASFNSMKNNNNKQINCTSSQPGQPKSLGSLVYDRVTKLTNSLTGSRTMGLKRSVSMVADSKPTQKSEFYIYADI